MGCTWRRWASVGLPDGFPARSRACSNGGTMAGRCRLSGTRFTYTSSSAATLQRSGDALGGLALASTAEQAGSGRLQRLLDLGTQQGAPRATWQLMI